MGIHSWELVPTVEGYYRIWDGDRLVADCGRGEDGKRRAEWLLSEVRTICEEVGRLRGVMLEAMEAQAARSGNPYEILADGLAGK